MKLEEAIEVLRKVMSPVGTIAGTKAALAIGIGIEALKFRRRWEEQKGEEDFPLLPGETKE